MVESSNAEGDRCEGTAGVVSGNQVAEGSPLRREVGLAGAVMMGLGSILGTGVFVSVAIATGVTGPSVVLAIALAALVAICNGLSSAQLAAAHPVSGGTYEYAYRLLNPWLGFTAGWMFLCAKSASAATAALGLAGAVNQMFEFQSEFPRVPLALAFVGLLTMLILAGIRRSNQTNMIIVAITLVALTTFVAACLPIALKEMSQNMLPFFSVGSEQKSTLASFLQATALMFVAFTGYGRIATLAEEVHEPRRTIPAAVIITLLISACLYIAVGFVGVASVGVDLFSNAGTRSVAPLQVVANRLGHSWVASLVAVGAVTAMLGVCMNLILGLSRVALAMARRRDIPHYFSGVHAIRSSPDPATWLVALMIAGLVLVGDVKTTWSFSAFTVLIYYAITNLAALRLPKPQRLYPAAIAWLGLVSCLGLAFWVDWQVWLAGLSLMAAGLLWHMVAKSLGTR